MKTVKVDFSNGNSITTEINGTDEDIKAYYLGREFNLGDGCGNDLMATGVRVTFLSQTSEEGKQ